MRACQKFSGVICIVSSVFLNTASAKTTLDLLDLPAKSSQLITNNIIVATTPIDNSVLAVGERGHIISWESDQIWEQHQVPVSVTLTAVTSLSDGKKVAVGHDGVILTSAVKSTQWAKVFTGHDLTQLKISNIEQQSLKLKQLIDNTSDLDELDELNYQLEELPYTLEEYQEDLDIGPNKPLLSVTRTTKNILFATGAYGTLLISHDKGDSWQLIDDRLENPDRFHLNSIISTSNDQLYIVGESGMAFHSDDHGATWTSLSLPYSGSLFGILSNESGKQLIAFGLQGNIVASNDSGVTWQHKKLPTSASLLGGTLSKDGHVYLVGHGGLIVDFDSNNLNDIQIRKHSAGATLASVMVKEDALILSGQFGISAWQLKK
jgi:photosystem II stability/assembly factor-like uncharacterized protein